MAKKKSTEPAQGRYDIVVFENGGWECIRKQDSVPVAPEELYRPKVADFINTLSLPKDAGKYSMRYTYEDGVCSISWSPLN